MNVKAKNGISNANNPLCEGFETLQQYHTTTHKRSYKFFVDIMTTLKIIYKDHILPTKEQIEWINKINRPVVILLRKPEDTIDNYKRLINDYKEGKLNAKTAKELKLELLCNIDFEAFCKDIEVYNQGWKDANIKKALYVDYNELVLCPYRICSGILRHYGFKMPRIKNFQLMKAKGNHGYNTFTGVGYERAKKEWQNIHS